MNKLNILSKNTLRVLITAACMQIASGFFADVASAQSKKVTTVSFQKDKFNRIFLPAKIDRDSLDILFSTYSKTLRLTPYFAETGSLYPSGDRLTIKDKKGRMRNRVIFYLPELRIGNLKFYHEETILNLALPDSLATGSTGTLLVNQYNWKIDNDRNQMSISKSPFTAERVYTSINYKKDSVPSAKVSVKGLQSDFILDLGSGGGFQINTSTALGQALLADYKLKPTTTVTSNIHGRKMVDTIYTAVVPSLLFNGVELKNQEVTLSSALPRNTIGTGFLGNYNVILNNSKKKKIESALILEKRLVD
jgi:hypothetical protein